MEAQQVVPDVLDTVPPHVTVVRFVTGAQIQLGNELTPTQVADQPITVEWPVDSPTSLYTVLFTDPDATSRQLPTHREILHWLVVNIPGGDISKGFTVMPYVGSGPPDGTGLHRYVYTVYKQPGELPGIELTTVYPASRRRGFNTRTFVAQHGLGAPISGNFYLAQFDEHVRTRRGIRLAPVMYSSQVVPDVIDEAPELTVEVKYPSGVIINFGDELTPTQVKDPPELVSWRLDSDDAGSLFTLVITDPDAPSRAEPKFREFLHWLVVNIPGRDIADGQTLVEYVGSGPPEGSGLHRYVCLVYRQPGPINPDMKPVSATQREGRRSFRIRDFARKYNFGQPVAANFYQAQYDDYVPKIAEQLSRG